MSAPPPGRRSGVLARLAGVVTLLAGIVFGATLGLVGLGVARGPADLLATFGVGGLGLAWGPAGLELTREAGEELCTPDATHPGWSVARQWDEALLDAIRRDLPAPTVHARNLFHVSVAMWDAWAAYDPVAQGYLVAVAADGDVDVPAGGSAATGVAGAIGFAELLAPDDVAPEMASDAVGTASDVGGGAAADSAALPARAELLTAADRAGGLDAARDQAISYAAYRVLTHRYRDSVGASDSLPAFDAIMRARCYPTDVTTLEGASPAALGNRIADAVIRAGARDGANEAGGYRPTNGYRPVNPPLEVATAGTTTVDPDRWQPLQLEEMIAQNGIPVTDGVQEFIGPHWGEVAGFALPPGDRPGLPMDPGSPPELHDPTTREAYQREAVEVVRLSSRLDPRHSPQIDVSPASIGANPLATDDGAGHGVNPVTGRPYEPNPVLAADFYRAVAEYWADGPDSETPPGHWNTLANAASDELAVDALRIGGDGPSVDRLEWDVKLYLALNAANHDAAVVAWGAKGVYDSARPISMIRHLGGLGQSSDPHAPAYDPAGLPLEPGLIELVTAETSAPGQRHAALAGHQGEVAVRAWVGRPDDPEREIGGVDWIRAVEWVPYQLPTFVSPAFAGYVSGHSTFSRASAEVLTAMTGSPYFPGGIASWTVPAGDFAFEAGPDRDVVLQWATYADAADQAGVSRLYGGIHIAADDLDGRRVGAACGQQAWALATRYFEGSR
jgi:hypothetical protein